ncbi:MAG: hypothetical protein Q8862_11465 [Bacteroidota bacterium]|nr:hypothetical protein [Bacteroidota bacterium]
MWLKIINVVLLATVKNIVTLPYAFLIGLNYQQAIISVVVGGILGFTFFYYLSGWLIKRFSGFLPRLIQVLPFRKTAHRLHEAYLNRERKIFSKTSRILVKAKSSYGMVGIAVATPVLLSIPFGAFLANKYYPGKKRILIYMSLSLVAWTGLFTGIFSLFNL